MACGGIHRPPYGGARSLLEWGIDLWHYVNGKAIVNGLRLASMESSDMLDVLHYFFEEDLNFSTAEQAEAREATRLQLYRDLYDMDYKYASPKTRRGDNGARTADFDIDEEVAVQEPLRPFDPKNPSGEVKPYVPPTRIDENAAKPFGSILDEPLG